MTTESRTNQVIDQTPFEQSATEPLEEVPMTETEPTEMEQYVASCIYVPGTVGYENYKVQNARQMSLPDLLESDSDIEEANKENSRRVRCYIPWDLAKEWGNCHHSARSASVLLQEALRAELERTPLPQVCQGCGGASESNGGYWDDAELGSASEVFYEIYTCTTCKKSQRDAVQVSRAHGVLEPSALEKHELWRYDNGIVWVWEDEGEPSQYALALKGFLIWTDYRRALEKNGWVEDPDFTKYIAAYKGKRKWDVLMAEAVDSEIERMGRPEV